jgi:UPF0716 protein FxsA
MKTLRLMAAGLLLVLIVEITLFVQLGGRLGVVLTLTWLALAALLGAILIRVQGWMTLVRAREALARGQLPALEMLEGLALVFAGILLIVPGFFTDLLAVLLVIRPLRRALVLAFIPRRPPPPPSRRGPPARGRVLNGEYRADD